MAEETIFQSWIFTKFILPFALIFALVYAILEKTKLLGEKHQINAIVAFIIGLLFTSFVYPVLVVQNMVLFLTVAIVVLFVILLLWGFIFGDIKEGFKPGKWMKGILGGIAIIAVVIAVVWAAGFHNKILELLFKQSWSSIFWTNFLFVLVIAIALALILKAKGDGGK